jgi:hypothetical protein
VALKWVAAMDQTRANAVGNQDSPRFDRKQLGVTFGASLLLITIISCRPTELSQTQQASTSQATPTGPLIETIDRSPEVQKKRRALIQEMVRKHIISTPHDISANGNCTFTVQVGPQFNAMKLKNRESALSLIYGYYCLAPIPRPGDSIILISDGAIIGTYHSTGLKN